MKKIIRIIVTIAIVAASFGAIAMVLSNNKNKLKKNKIVAQENARVVVRVDTAARKIPGLEVVANGNLHLPRN